MEPQELRSWLVVAGFLTVLSLLFRWAFTRRILVDWLSRLGRWAADHLTPTPEPDPLAAELARVLRTERLYADVRRLQRIIATDMSMSATRQLGNRLAYDWLVRELAASRAPRVGVSGPAASDDWRVDTRPVVTTSLLSGMDSRRMPKVETLEIGWRR